MAQPDSGRVGVVIEKPFGHDLDSAVDLNHKVNAVFNENQVFRIDHYLGKETVQNILVFRFANGIFEPIWNRNYIDHVQITAAETIGVEGRGPFYEKAGALRDVVQNHVMELLSFVAMEPPSSFDAESVRREKVKVWQAIPPIPILNAVRGQYGPGVVEGKKVIGYRDEDRVNPESGTETYAALRLEIENWRWAGVPFYLRAGKRLKQRATEISIQFKQPPLLIFNRMQSNGPCTEISPTCSPSASSPTKASPCASAPRCPPRRHGRLPRRTWTSTTRRPSAPQAPTATNVCCSMPCSATRRSSRIAMALKPPGRSTRRSSKPGRPRTLRFSPTTSPAPGARIAPIAFSNATATLGATTSSASSRSEKPCKRISAGPR